MTEVKTTVDSFFGFSSLAKPGSEVYEEIVENLPLEKIREALRESKPSLAVLITAESILDSLASLLNIPLWDVLKQAWTEGKLFERYWDPQKYDPKALIEIVLNDHEISSSYEPCIDVVLNDNRIGAIDFQLTLVLALSKVTLKVRNGLVEEVHAGEIKGLASLACEGFPLFEKEAEKLDLSRLIRYSAQASASSVEPRETQ